MNEVNNCLGGTLRQYIYIFFVMLYVLSHDSALCSQREDLEGLWNEHSTIQKVIGEFSGERRLSLANEERNSVKTLLSHAKSGLRTSHVTNPVGRKNCINS